MPTDVRALGLAWYASRQAERPANARQTYGFHRAGILAAQAERLDDYRIERTVERTLAVYRELVGDG